VIISSIADLYEDICCSKLVASRRTLRMLKARKHIPV